MHAQADNCFSRTWNSADHWHEVHFRGAAGWLSGGYWATTWPVCDNSRRLPILHSIWIGTILLQYPSLKARIEVLIIGRITRKLGLWNTVGVDIRIPCRQFSTGGSVEGTA